MTVKTERKERFSYTHDLPLSYLACNIFFMTTNELPYRDRPEINISLLALLRFNPRAFYEAWTNPIEKTSEALTMGIATHTCHLEPKNFLHQYVRFEGELRSNAQKALWAKHIEEGRTPLKAKNYDKCLEISNELRKHPLASTYFQAEGVEFEQDYYWEDPDTGTKCKGRLDMVAPTWMGDLKTAKSVQYRAFNRSCFQYGYFGKLAWYRDGVDIASRGTIDKRKAIVVAVNKEDRPSSAVYPFPEETLENGKVMYKNWLRLFEFCKKNDYWPGVNNDQPVDMYMEDWQIEPAKKYFMAEDGTLGVL